MRAHLLIFAALLAPDAHARQSTNIEDLRPKSQAAAMLQSQLWFQKGLHTLIEVGKTVETHQPAQPLTKDDPNYCPPLEKLTRPFVPLKNALEKNKDPTVYFPKPSSVFQSDHPTDACSSAFSSQAAALRSGSADLRQSKADFTAAYGRQVEFAKNLRDLIVTTPITPCNVSPENRNKAKKVMVEGLEMFRSGYEGVLKDLDGSISQIDAAAQQAQKLKATCQSAPNKQ